MGLRQFGVVNGAGTRVKETTPSKPISLGVLGFTAIVGAFRTGPIGEVKRLPFGEPQYRSIYGGLTRDSQAPLAAEHFYRAGEGNGELACLRLTDGTELYAQARIYDRRVPRSILWRSPASEVPRLVATVKDASGGRAGGRARFQGGTTCTINSSTEVEISIGTSAPLEDEWVGAILTFPDDAPGEEYVVSANTAASPAVVTIDGELSEAAQAASGEWVLELENVHEITGSFEAVAVEIGDGDADPTRAVSVTGYRDGSSVGSWLNKDFVATGRRYLVDAINDDTSNFLIEWDDEYAGVGSANNQLDRPANFAEVPTILGLTSAAPNVLQLQTWRWQRTSPGAGTAYVQSLTHGSAAKPCTIVLTFTSATAFTVAATLHDGEEAIANLAAGGTASAYQPGVPFLPEFRVRAGAVAMSAGDTITIYVRPLPSGLGDKGGYLYAAASSDDGDVRKRWRIASNTFDTLTFPSSVDLSAGGISAPTVPSHSSSGNGPYTVANGETLIYSLPGTGTVTLTNTLVGAQTAAALAAHLQTLEDTSATATALRRVVFTATAAGKLVISAVNDAGSEAILTIGAGTINTPVLFTAGDYAGEDGTIVRLQWRQELRGGYDGLVGLDASKVAEAFDLDTSPLNDLLVEDTGLITVAAPGWFDAEVNQAGTRWAHATNGGFLWETDPAIVTEAAAIAAHISGALTEEQMNYQAAYFPSYGKLASPYGAGLYTASCLGALLGAMARKANADAGYHTAPAGEALDIGAIFRDLVTGSTPLDNEMLNGYGLIELRKRGIRIYPWGDRCGGGEPIADGTPPWFHKRRASSHIGRVLLTNTPQFTWAPVNDKTFVRVKRDLTALFDAWWRAGWFDDSGGTAFEDQVQIKCDATNNPLTSRQGGYLNTEVGYLIVNTAEKVVHSIGPLAVSEASG